MEGQRLTAASQEQLRLVLSFFSRVDAKGSVVLAVDTGMLGFLATRFPTLQQLRWWDSAFAGAAFALLAVSIMHLYRGAFPVLAGGHDSLIYFAEIAKRTETKFIDEFAGLDDARYSKDLLGQVWRNSEILKAKFSCVKQAFIFTAWAVLPWTGALVSFALKTKPLV